jgi:hypothetical protein
MRADFWKRFRFLLVICFCWLIRWRLVKSQISNLSIFFIQSCSFSSNAFRDGDDLSLFWDRPVIFYSFGLILWLWAKILKISFRLVYLLGMVVFKMTIQLTWNIRNIWRTQQANRERIVIFRWLEGAESQNTCVLMCFWIGKHMCLTLSI